METRTAVLIPGHDIRPPTPGTTQDTGSFVLPNTTTLSHPFGRRLYGFIYHTRRIKYQKARVIEHWQDNSSHTLKEELLFTYCRTKLVIISGLIVRE
jgi:hypothetical protein